MSNRYHTTAKGYVFDKYIFRTLSALLIILAVAAIGFYGLGNNYYLHCPEDARGGWCMNPLRGVKGCEQYQICDQQLLRAGFTIGEPEPEALSYIPASAFLLFAAAFAINHYKHNRGKKWSLA